MATSHCNTVLDGSATMDTSQLVKASRPKEVSKLCCMLMHPWHQAVVLQGEPSIGKANLIKRIAAEQQKDLILVQCCKTTRMMDVLQDIICKLEQCRLQHVGGQISRKVKCVDAADFIDVLIDLCPDSEPLKCIVVDNVEHIAMTRELEVLMNAPSHSGFMAHATIILLSDKCWQADIHHDDLPDIAVIHIPAFTTTEVRQVLADNCPMGACLETWTWFVMEHVDKFLVKSRHLTSLRDVMWQAYFAFVQLAAKHPGSSKQWMQNQFLPQYKQMVQKFTPASDISFERKDLPSTEEVLAMGGSKQVMMLALYAAEWTKPEFDKDILHVLKSQERKRTIYIKSLLKTYAVEQAMQNGPYHVPKERLLNYFAYFVHIVSQMPSVSRHRSDASQLVAVDADLVTSSNSGGQLLLSKKGGTDAHATLTQLLRCNLISQGSNSSYYHGWLRDGMAAAVSKNLGLGDLSNHVLSVR